MKGYTFFIIIAVLLVFFASVSAMPIFNKGNVLVLTYHRLSTDIAMANDYTVTPGTFEADIKLLKEKGYEFLKASQLKGELSKDRKIAVITFDDGYKSDLEYAVPILEKYSACGTFFIIGEMIGKSGYMSEDDIKLMSQKDCCEIGNHSYSIHNLFPSTLSIMYRNGRHNDYIIGDFKKNNELLQKITGKSPTSLSYPNGIFNSFVDKSLCDLGITVTFSTKETSYKSPLVPIGRKNRGQDRNINNLL